MKKYEINLLKRLKIKYLLRITTLIPVFLVALFFAAFYNGQYNKELKAHTLRLGEAYIRQLLPVAAHRAPRPGPHRPAAGPVVA